MVQLIYMPVFVEVNTSFIIKIKTGFWQISVNIFARSWCTVYWGRYILGTVGVVSHVVWRAIDCALCVNTWKPTVLLHISASVQYCYCHSSECQWCGDSHFLSSLSKSSDFRHLLICIPWGGGGGYWEECRFWQCSDSFLWVFFFVRYVNSLDNAPYMVTV